MSSRLRFAGFIVVMILISISTSSLLAQKKDKTPPEPEPIENPLFMSDGLNIVTTERLGNPKLRVFGGTENSDDVIAFEPIWTQPEVYPSLVVLADVDGDGSTEIVYPAAYTLGTLQEPLYGILVQAFRQGVDGVAYSIHSDDLKNLICSSTANASFGELLAYDFDGDGSEEIILGTTYHFAIFKLLAGEQTFSKIAEADLGEIGMSIAGTPLTRRGLAIGDIVGDASVEIVAAGIYRNDDRQDVAYLLQFDFDPNTHSLEYSYVNLSDDFSVNDVRIANSDSIPGNEIWCSGWVNHWEEGTYEQKVFSWTVDSQSNGLSLNQTYYHNFGELETLGPDLIVGDLTGDHIDEIVISFGGRPGSFAIYKAGEEIPLAFMSYPDTSAYAAAVVEGKLFVRGTQVVEVRRNKTAKGIFLDCLRLKADNSLENIWSWRNELDGSELWDIAVGRGKKIP